MGGWDGGFEIKRFTQREIHKCEGEGEVAFFSAKRWDRRNRADLIESATPCHDALAVGSYRDSNPLRLTVLAAMSEDYTTAPQHLQMLFVSKILDLLLWLSTHVTEVKYFHSGLPSQFTLACASSMISMKIIVSTWPWGGGVKWLVLI